MPLYSYVAKSLKGEGKTGMLEAKDKHQLSRTLREQGFILVKAELGEKKASRKQIEISIPFLDMVSLADKLMFTRNLQVMVASGLPLPRALETLALQAQSKKFKKALLAIKNEVVKGENLSSSLAKYPGIFSELFQSMIKVGEETGTIDEVLQVLTRQLERENDLKTKIRGALMYPAVIVSAMVGIGILMLVMVVPKLAETFEELAIELPLTTRAVIGLGTFLSERWYFALIIFIFLIILAWRLLKLRGVKRTVDFLFLKLPIISPLVRKSNSAYLARTLSSLMASGVSIVRSLEITSGTLGNIYFRESLSGAAEKVRKGEKLSDALEVYQRLYPLIIFQMLKVGEETGETSKILAKLADFFEEEVANATKNLASVVEPVLMLIVGAAVGFFAISMIQPMYSMLNAI